MNPWATGSSPAPTPALVRGHYFVQQHFVSCVSVEGRRAAPSPSNRHKQPPTPQRFGRVGTTKAHRAAAGRLTGPTAKPNPSGTTFATSVKNILTVHPDY